MITKGAMPAFDCLVRFPINKLNALDILSVHNGVIS